MSATFVTGGTQRLTTTIRRTNGRLEIINFEAPILFGNVGVARYITSDKEVIEKLKQHRSFGSLFYLQSETEEAPQLDSKQTKELDYRDLCKDKENIVEELSVVDVATAQNWCQRTHGTVFKARKAETIKAEAAEKYNTVFPNFN